MFKKLKEKIAEEVKPLKIPQFSQSVVTPSNNAVVDSALNEHFSLDDELPNDSFGNEGFSVVDLHHPSLPVPLPSGRFSRQSSMSSLASDASAFLPIHDASLGTFNMQDLESASEREDVLPQMNNLSKQELCNSYLKLYRHYQKYKGRATDLKTFCRELEKDNKKHKTVLLECQEKSLRRIAELKEQCALEQHAKAHLEEALRNDLEEKDHLIQTLQTKIKLLKDAYSASSPASIWAEDENLLLMPGEIAEDYKEDLLGKEDSRTQQEQQTETSSQTKGELESPNEETEIIALKEKFEYLKERILKNSSVNIQDISVMTEFQGSVNELSVCLISRISSPLSYGQELLANCAINKNLHVYDNNVGKQDHSLLYKKLQLSNSETIGNDQNRTLLDSISASQNVQLNNQDLLDVIEQETSEQLGCLTSAISTDVVLEQTNKCSCQNKVTNDLTELENELAVSKASFAKVTQELEDSHQKISEQNSTVNKLREQLTILQSEVESYDEKGNVQTVNTLKSQLMETKDKLGGLQQQIFSAQHTIEEKECIIKETTENLTKIHQELDSVLVHKSEMAKMLAEMQAELMDTKSSCEQLTHKIQTAIEVTQEKESIIELLRNEKEKVIKELEIANSETNKDNEKIAFLESELKETKLKYGEISEELIKVSNELESANKQNNKENETVASLENDLKETKLKYEQVSKELTNVIQELESANSQNKIGYEMVASLENELKETRLKYKKISEELREVSRELKAVNTQNIKENEMVASLENDLKETKFKYEKITKELTKVSQELKSANSQNEKGNEMVASLENELKETKLKYEKILEDSTKANKELKSVNSLNKIKIEMVASLENELQETKLKYEKILEELAKVNEELESANSQNKIEYEMVVFLENELKETIHKYEKICEELTNVNKELESANSHNKIENEMVASLENKLKETKLEHEKICEELSKVNKELESANSQNKIGNEMVVFLENELQETKLKYERIFEELREVNRELQSTNSQNKIGNEVVASLENKLKETELKYERISEELTKANGDLESANSQNKIGNDMVASLENELRETKLKYENTSKELIKVNKKLESANSRNNKRNEMVTSLENELKETKLKYENISKELQYLSNATEEKNVTITNLEEKMAALDEKFDKTSAQKVKAYKMVSALENELKNINIHFGEAIKELQSVHMEVEEKDSHLNKASEELTQIRQELNSALKEKVDATALVQNQLVNANLELEKLREDLVSAYKEIDSKDSDIINMKQDMENLQRKLQITSSLNAEKNKMVKDFENDFKEKKAQLDKVAEEINSSHKLIKDKDLTIASINNELVAVHKNLEIILSQKVEASEMTVNLQSELADMNRHLEQMTRVLQSAQKSIDEKDSFSTKVSEELCIVHKEFDLSTPENSGVEKVTALQNELRIIRANFKELSEEFQCASKLLCEKDLKIAGLNEHLTIFHKVLDTASIEKHNFNERLSSFKNQLTNIKLQFEKETQSLYHANEDKMLLQEKLSNVQKELDLVSLQKTEACAMVKDLQDELNKLKLDSKHVTKKFQEVHELIEERDTISAVEDETYECVTSLQKELNDSKVRCSEVSEELESTLRLIDEKNSFIELLKNNIVKIKQELSEASDLNAQTSENISNLQSELDTKLNLKQIAVETKSANQILDKIEVDPYLVENIDISAEVDTITTRDTAELGLVLQSKLERIKHEFENMVVELKSSRKIIEDQDTNIKRLENDLTVVREKLKTSDHKEDTDNVILHSRSKLLENTFPLENSEHVSKSVFSYNNADSRSGMINSRGESSQDRNKFCSKNTRECSEESSIKKESDGGTVCEAGTVLCTDSEQEVNRKRLEKCISNDTEVISANQTTRSCQDNCIVSNQESCEHMLYSVPELQESSSESNHSTYTSQIKNIESRSVAKEQKHSEKSLCSEDSSRLFEEGDVLEHSEKPIKNDHELVSRADKDTEIKMSINRNLQAVPVMGDGDGHQTDELQFSSIQNILENIQKENKEYGSLLECHKGIINHLEGIAKMHTEGIQPGSAEWLHKQLVLLSQKLYDTKEKQSLQIASINRLVKHQQDLMKSDCDEAQMTIEMQYLRNIVFQYMIGKETMLLAKVISAVMKFDQKQMDQVMQKEVQKQTLFGQLGLL